MDIIDRCTVLPLKVEQMTIPKNTLSLAAEFAVASELCRRGIYAQLTLGNLKRTDLLVLDTENHRMLRIEVKAKQKHSWPNCRGIYGKNILLVLVDFYQKREMERPDFYILTVEDWVELAHKVIAAHPDDRIELDEYNVLFWPKQNYKGTGVIPEQVGQHRERWDKVDAALAHSASTN